MPRGSLDDPLAPLARAVLASEPMSERRFLKAVAPLVLRVVRKVLGPDHPDVEDVCQEALIGTLEAIARFRQKSTVGYFVQRIALLTALNARRRHQLRDHLVPRADFDEARLGEAGGATPVESILVERRRRSFEALLDELPAAQAETLALHCILGYTVAETAELCGVPVNTVRGRLVSAKAALRRRLDNDTALKELLRGVS